MLDTTARTRMEQMAATVLKDGGECPPHTSYALASAVQLLLQSTKPVDPSVQQARLAEIEREVITLDYHGKDIKRAKLREFCVELFGWSPWARE
jgi:hypothetical protein